jgi:hypothetical protein
MKVAQEKKHKKIDREEQVHTNTHYTVQTPTLHPTSTEQNPSN